MPAIRTIQVRTGMVADNVSRWLVELGPDVIGVPASQMNSAH